MLHTSSIKSDKSKISSVKPVLFKCYLFVLIMCSVKLTSPSGQSHPAVQSSEHCICLPNDSQVY